MTRGSRKEDWTPERREKLRQSTLGRKSPRKGVILSKETKQKISLANKGKKQSVATIKKRLESRKGFKHSEETKVKMSIAKKGMNWLQKKPRTIEHRIKLSLTINKGKCSLAQLIAALPEYKLWRRQIFKRDNYTCQECFARGIELEAHHKNKKFSQLLQEFLTEYSQFSPFEDKEILVRLAITCEPFWDIDNGQTLCRECHKKLSQKFIGIK